MNIINITVLLIHGSTPIATFTTSAVDAHGIQFKMTAELPSQGWQMFLLDNYPDIPVYEINCRYTPPVISAVDLADNSTGYYTTELEGKPYETITRIFTR
jgi:hypothetical protein